MWCLRICKVKKDKQIQSIPRIYRRLKTWPRLSFDGCVCHPCQTPIVSQHSIKRLPTANPNICQMSSCHSRWLCWCPFHCGNIGKLEWSMEWLITVFLHACTIDNIDFSQWLHFFGLCQHIDSLTLPHELHIEDFLLWRKSLSDEVNKVKRPLGWS